MAKKMKNVLLMGLSFVLVAALAIGGTIAYLTDTDSDVNVMTLGNVKIQQNEQQRVEKDGEFSSELEDYVQGKVMMPYTSRTGTKDTYTVGTHKVNKSDNVNNYVDKIVSVTNIGKTDAYVRTLLAIPTGGSAWEPNPVAAADTWLHWNTTSDMNSHWYSMWSTQEGHTYAGVFAEIDGQGYYVFEFTHKTAIEPDYTTFPTLLGCYMDNRVNHDDEGYFMDMNSNGKYDDGDKRIEDVEVGGSVEILVLSQATQKAGFADAQTALDTSFGDVNAANVAEWFGDVSAPAVVKTAAELTAALATGEDVILDADIEVNGNLTLKADATLYGNGYTLSDVQLYMNEGSTVQNVKFDGTEAEKGSQIYAYSGSVTIKDCTFKNANWDAIQATPTVNDHIVIDGCTFAANTANNGQARSVHIEVDASKDSDGDGIIDRADLDANIKLTLTNNHFDMTQTNISNWNGKERVTNETTFSGLQPENIIASGNTYVMADREYSEEELKQVIGYFHRTYTDGQVTLVTHTFDELKTIFGMTEVE